MTTEFKIYETGIEKLEYQQEQRVLKQQGEKCNKIYHSSYTDMRQYLTVLHCLYSNADIVEKIHAMKKQYQLDYDCFPKIEYGFKGCMYLAYLQGKIDALESWRN